jgi:hypothetical protein
VGVPAADELALGVGVGVTMDGGGGFEHAVWKSARTSRMAALRDGRHLGVKVPSPCLPSVGRRTRLFY